MKKLLTGILALGLANAASAATFTYQDNSAGASAQTNDGITVTFSAPLPGQTVGYYGGFFIPNAERGVGIDQGISNALSQGEQLRINFDQFVEVDTIRLGQWQVSESVTFTASNGNSVTWNTESAAFSSYESVDVSSLGAFNYIDFTANTFTTNATINQISGVSAVPLPTAAWLFGSALLGLVGVARRKRA